MILLSASKISKTFSENEILKDISFSISSGEKIGILGVNGAGKSTLFKILTGETEPDGGSIYKHADLKICHVRQQINCDTADTAYNTVLSAFSDLDIIKNELARAEKDMESDPSDENIQKYHNLNQKFIDCGGLTYESKISSALTGLGIDRSLFNMPMNKLSGGQRTKVALAKILLEDADLLLLDEPTNHLDIKAINWLEGFLYSYKGAVLLITHDRYFLDKVVNKIFEIEHSKLKEYNGNYSRYISLKEEYEKAVLKDYTLKQKEIHRIEGIIQQQKQFNREKNIKTAESKQKMIDRIKKDMVKPEDVLKTLSFKFGTAGECANDVLVCEGLSKSFSKPLFENIDIDIKKGDKAFLLGDNGCGKTTLFNIITGKIRADKGRIKIGPRVKTAYYDQTQSGLNLKNTVFDEISDAFPAMDNTSIRCALAVFLFTGDDVFKTISTLSGGERARVSLCKLMLSDSNFLFLDEPTNHLDIPSKEALEKALESYSGTLFVISHDRYFINKIATKVYQLKENHILCVDGNYDYFLSYTAASERPGIPKNKTEKGLDFKLQKDRLSSIRKLKTGISRLEETISELENSKEKLSAEMILPENSTNFELLSDLSSRLDETDKKLSEAMEEWENLNTELEEKENEL